MRTTIDIPGELLSEAQRLADTRTKAATVIMALQEYVSRRQALEAFDRLRGSVVFMEGVDSARHLKSSADRSSHGKERDA